jgi:hypothetical protein
LLRFIFAAALKAEMNGPCMTPADASGFYVFGSRAITKTIKRMNGMPFTRLSISKKGR